ncbi:MAG: T9SS type A sorting domain-containing protein [Saprospiraceae bacterium]|nr:T9SS type A sorting domain-containing protein [Saprospiraceae bacterium]
MKKNFSKSLWLLLAVWICGYCSITAQNPDWPIVPNLVHFNSGGGSPSGFSGSLGSYTTPYFAANSAHDASGNLMFYVVNENIYDSGGNPIGSTGQSSGSNGKDILILPDPKDCDDRLILSGNMDIIPNGGAHYHVCHLNATRVSKTGAVQPNVFSYTIFGNDNYFMSMVLSKPKPNGDRIWYVVTSSGAHQFNISTSGITFGSDIHFISFIAEPTDAEVSPSGDRLAWSNASINASSSELRWVNLNPNGSFGSLGGRFLSNLYWCKAYGLEFVNNSEVLVAAKLGGGSGSSGIFKCDFITLTAPVSTNAAYAESQLEKALDGNIYAASSTGLWGIGTPTPINVTVKSNYFGNVFVPSILYYSLPKQLDYENYADVFGCCPPNVTITGIYSKPLTESQTWIKTLGACSIAAGFTVKLDADPLNGYVELNPGFEANAALNVVFIAQAFNGCAPGAPLRPLPGVRDDNTPQPELKIENATFNLYPNPTSGDVTLEFDQATPTAVNIVVSDLLGRSISQEMLDAGSSQHRISLSSAPSGIYLVRVLDGGRLLWSGKLVKE